MVPVFCCSWAQFSRLLLEQPDQGIIIVMIAAWIVLVPPVPSDFSHNRADYQCIEGTPSATTFTAIDIFFILFY